MTPIKRPNVGDSVGMLIEDVADSEANICPIASSCESHDPLDDKKE